jgi:hypothetical protein
MVSIRPCPPRVSVNQAGNRPVSQELKKYGQAHREIRFLPLGQKRFQVSIPGFCVLNSYLAEFICGMKQHYQNTPKTGI